jgi:hypothetical protein
VFRYTLGNLYFEIQKYKQASQSLGRSLETLRVTHGTTCRLVSQLNDLYNKSCTISKAMSKGGGIGGIGGIGGGRNSGSGGSGKGKKKKNGGKKKGKNGKKR